MAVYTPTEWEDEVPGEDPVTYDIAGLTAGKTIVPHVAVTPGTPVNATNMNHIEAGIEDAQAMARAPVTHRQGDTGAWGENYGTTNFDTSAVPQIMQVGCAAVGYLGDFDLTFPVPFSAAPVVIATSGQEPSVGIIIVANYITTTGCHLSAWSGQLTRANSVYTHWLAIGPA
jgi:hypothetical protein